MENRFEIVEKQSFGIIRDVGNTNILIIRDKVTGILYLSNQMGGGGGLTPLLDSDGKLVVSLVCPECGFAVTKEMTVCPECGCPLDF